MSQLVKPFGRRVMTNILFRLAQAHTKSTRNYQVEGIRPCDLSDEKEQEALCKMVQFKQALDES